MNYLCAIVGGIAVSGYYVIAAWLSRNDAYFSTHPREIIRTSYLTAGAILLPVWVLCLWLGHISTPSSSAFWLGMTLSVILDALSREAHIRALMRLNVGFVSSLSAITPLLSILSGVFLLGELPSGRALTGIIIVSLSIGVMARMTLKTDLCDEPLDKRAMCFGAVSVVLPALGIALDRIALQASDPLNYAMLSSGSLGLLHNMPVLVGCKTLRQLITPFFSGSSKWILLGGFLLATTQMSFAYITSQNSTAQSSAISRIAIVFQIVMARFILAEHQYFYRKLCCALCIILGVYLVLLTPSAV